MSVSQRYVQTGTKITHLEKLQLIRNLISNIKSLKGTEVRQINVLVREK
jgi:hypothetical protein